MSRPKPIWGVSILVSLLAICLPFNLSNAQQPEKTNVVSLPQDDPCGKLLMVDSCLMDLYVGEVTAIEDGGMLRIRLKLVDPSTGLLIPPGGAIKEKHVLLAGVTVPALGTRFGREAKAMLAEVLLHKSCLVDVFCPGWYERKITRAKLHGNDTDAALELIRLGLARYERTGGARANYDCHYRLVESEARATGVGIWGSEQEKRKNF
jgi:endonuclease YncB( thermonuclease family)